MRKPRILTWWSARPRNVHLAVRPVAPEVAGAVEAVARLAGERVRAEALGGQRLVAQVAAGQVRAAHPDLPDLADAGQPAPGVDDQELHVAHPAAEREDLRRPRVRDLPLAHHVIRRGRAASRCVP